MPTYQEATDVLFKIIHEMAKDPGDFVKNSETDFKRKRKLDFEKMIKIIISMEGGNLRKELHQFFDYTVDTPTASAFIQQRNKFGSGAFTYLFDTFNSQFPYKKTFNGYRLLAIDGSTLSFADKSINDTTYVKCSNKKGYNKLHLNACFDLCENRYTDMLVQPGALMDERKAYCQLVDRAVTPQKTIFIADRGYESYNCFAHALEKNYFFLTRVKDIHSNGILGALELDDDTFDKSFQRILTRKQTIDVKQNAHAYRFMPSNQNFDFDGEGDYMIHFRVVRLKISETTYESIITNLPEDAFSLNDIKTLYTMRWGIETAFRTLKYTVGLMALHTKKVAFISQELYSKLLLFNLCQLVAASIPIQKQHTKHAYKLNACALIETIRYFFSKNECPNDINTLFLKHILPIRTNRLFERSSTARTTAVPLNYRIA
jgi:hypothetical protein